MTLEKIAVLVPPKLSSDSFGGTRTAFFPESLGETWHLGPLLHGLANFVPFNSRTLFPECLFTNRGILDFSTVKLPTVKLPTVKMPTVKLPTVKMPRLVNY